MTTGGNKYGTAFVDDEKKQKPEPTLEERLNKVKKKTQEKINEAQNANKDARERIVEQINTPSVWEHAGGEFPEKEKIIEKINKNVSGLLDIRFDWNEEYDKDAHIDEIIRVKVALDEQPEISAAPDFDITEWRLHSDDREFSEFLLGTLLRFYEPETIKKELYGMFQKNFIRINLLGERDIYADYRYLFISEKYEQIFSSLPKNFKNKYTEGYLREAFMLLHVIYAYTPNIEIMDEREIASVICEKNDILPAAECYFKPYTIGFLMDLSKYGVFNQIKRMVNSKLLLDQIQSLTTITAMKLDDMQNGWGDIQTRDIKDLSSVFNTLKKTYEELSKNDRQESVAYVYNDPVDAPDYRELIDFEVINPEGIIEIDMKYYIKAFKVNPETDKKEFVGYVYHDQIKNQYLVSENKMDIWIVRHGDKVALAEVDKIFKRVQKEARYPEYKLASAVMKEEDIV